MLCFKPSEALRWICVMNRPVITDDFPSSELLTDVTGSFTQWVEMKNQISLIWEWIIIFVFRILNQPMHWQYLTQNTVCSGIWWYFTHELLRRPWQLCPQWILSLFTQKLSAHMLCNISSLLKLYNLYVIQTDCHLPLIIIIKLVSWNQDLDRPDLWTSNLDWFGEVFHSGIWWCVQTPNKSE